LKSELAPIEDRGVVFGVVSAPQGSTPQYTSEQLRADRGDGTRRSPRPQPSPRSRGSRRSSTAMRYCGSSPGRSAPATRRQIATSLRPQMMSIRGRSRSRSAALARAVVPLAAGRVRDHVAGAIRGAVAHRRPLRRRGPQVPGVQNLQTDLRLNTPEGARPDQPRQAFRRSPVNVEHRGPHAGDDAGGRQVTRFKRDGEQYDVMVQWRPTTARRRRTSATFNVRGRGGEMVQPPNLVDVEGVRWRPQSLNPLQPPARGEGDRHARARLLDRRGAEGVWTPPPGSALPC